MEVLYFVVGIAIGIVTTILLSILRSPGSIVIDRSDPDSPYPFLEGKVPLPVFEQRKYVTLKVEKRNYLSHD